MLKDLFIIGKHKLNMIERPPSVCSVPVLIHLSASALDCTDWTN